MKTRTLILIVAIVAFPIFYISACAPARVSYGVSVNAGPHWGGYHHHHRHYHHRPSYRHHSRPPGRR